MRRYVANEPKGEMKKCRTCGETKSVKCFYPRKQVKSGLTASCTSCIGKRSDTPKKRRWYTNYLASKYET